MSGLKTLTRGAENGYYLASILLIVMALGRMAADANPAWHCPVGHWHE